MLKFKIKFVVLKNRRLSKSLLKWTSILYNIIGIMFFIISLYYIRKFTSDDLGFIMFKNNHWAAADTTFHSGSLKISVKNKRTGNYVGIDEVYLSNSAQKENMDFPQCPDSIEVRIKNKDFCMLNIKTCNDSQWIVDRFQYINYDTTHFILDKYIIDVNNSVIDARNVGRYGNEYNFFLDLKKIN